jgi:hypothetical protein
VNHWIAGKLSRYIAAGNHRSHEFTELSEWAIRVNHVDVLPGGTVRVATSREAYSEGILIGIPMVKSPFAEHKVRIMRELERKLGRYQPPARFGPGVQLGSQTNTAIGSLLTMALGV